MKIHYLWILCCCPNKSGIFLQDLEAFWLTFNLVGVLLMNNNYSKIAKSWWIQWWSKNTLLFIWVWNYFSGGSEEPTPGKSIDLTSVHSVGVDNIML